MVASRGRAAAVLVVLALAAAGCDTLLGLRQFRDVPCAFDCPDGSVADTGLPEASILETSVPDAIASAEAAQASDASDAAVLADAVDELLPPRAPGPHETWAHWPMPNPDASIAPDSATLLPHPMTYDAGADGAVLDTVTGLIWEVGSTASDYAGAWQHCQTIGMRVPTRIELVSLVDFTTSPAIDSNTFPGTPREPFWTSSVVAADAGPDAAVQYWSVSFADGLVDNATQGQYVRCVTGGSP